MSDLMAIVTTDPLDPTVVSAAVDAPECGAIVSFTGVVRNHDGGREVSMLEYSAHPLAQRFLYDCCRSVEQETGLRVAAIHRIGTLHIGDLALVAAVSAAHRADAFDACKQLIERIKTDVPIWKRQNYATGRSHWVGL